MTGDTPLSGSLRAAVVTVGDELLLGRTVDTNAAWLGRELAALGIPIVRRHTVADEAGEIGHAVTDALSVAELVVVTGGLGPTPDDLTRDAVAELLGRPLEVDEEVLEGIRIRFREHGIEELPVPNRRVAEVPRGARKLTNPVGTAPGLAMEHEGRLVVLLPGVPREMKGIFHADLIGALRERFQGRMVPVHTRSVRTTGIPESLLSQRIGERLTGGLGPLGLAFLPDERGVDLRLTAVGLSGEEAERRFDDMEERLADILDPWRFDAPDGDLVEAVTSALRGGRRTLAVAESCTGGLIAKRMTDFAGASDVFLGGVVAYANEVKVGLLGVDGAHLEAGGAVSEVVARAMAEGVARSFGADAGHRGHRDRGARRWNGGEAGGDGLVRGHAGRPNRRTTRALPRRPDLRTRAFGAGRALPPPSPPGGAGGGRGRPRGLNEPGGGWYLERPVALPRDRVNSANRTSRAMTDSPSRTDDLEPIEDIAAAEASAGGGPHQGDPAPVQAGSEVDTDAADDPDDDPLDEGSGAEIRTGETLDQELLELREEFEGLNDRHLRLAAEFNNYRRRVDAERRDVWGRAQAEIVGKFVDVLDDLQRVAGLDLTNATVEGIMEGIDLVERKFLRMLADAGVEMLDPVGERFNPETMEAMLRVPAESEDDDDRVAQVFQKGYALDGNLIRPARVSVHKHG